MQIASKVQGTRQAPATQGGANLNKQDKGPLRQSLKAQLLTLILIVLAVVSVSDGDLTAAPSAANSQPAMASDAKSGCPR